MLESKQNEGFEKGAAILLISAIAVKLIGALFKIPLSSSYCLGDLGFGYFSAAYDLFSPFYYLAMSGLPVAVAKITAEHIAEKRYNAARNILKVSHKVYLKIGMIIFIALAVLIYPFVRLTDTTGKSIYSFIAMIPSVIFCCAMSSYRGYYEGLLDMKPTAVSEVIEALCKLILGFFFGYITVTLSGNLAYGAAAAMFGITVGTALSTLYLRLFYNFKGDGISHLLSAENKTLNNITSKSLLIIAIPIALASLSNNIALIIDALLVRIGLNSVLELNSEFIRNLYSVSIADYNNNALYPITDNELVTLLYGIRGKAYTIYNLVPTFTTVISVSAVPVIAGLNAIDDKSGVSRNVNSVLKLTAFITFPAGMGFIVASKRIMSLIYDSTASTEIGGKLLFIYGIAVLFSGFVIPLIGILQSLGKQRIALINIAIGTAFKVILTVVLIKVPTLNILGAGISTLICYFVIFILDIIILIALLKVKLNLFKIIFKPLVSALICGAFAYLILCINTSEIYTVLAIVFAGIIYFTVLILLNFFEADDFMTFSKGDKISDFCRKHKIIR